MSYLVHVQGRAGQCVSRGHSIQFVFYLLSQQPTIQLVLIRPVPISSWLIAQQTLYSDYNMMPPPSDCFFFYSLLAFVLRSGHGGEDPGDETQDEQVQAGRRFGLQAGAGLSQGKEGAGYPFRYMSHAFWAVGTPYGASSPSSEAGTYSCVRRVHSGIRTL